MTKSLTFFGVLAVLAFTGSTTASASESCTTLKDDEFLGVMVDADSALKNLRETIEAEPGDRTAEAAVFLSGTPMSGKKQGLFFTKRYIDDLFYSADSELFKRAVADGNAIPGVKAETVAQSLYRVRKLTFAVVKGQKTSLDGIAKGDTRLKAKAFLAATNKLTAHYDCQYKQNKSRREARLAAVRAKTLGESSGGVCLPQSSAPVSTTAEAHISASADSIVCAVDDANCQLRESGNARRVTSSDGLCQTPPAAVNTSRVAPKSDAENNQSVDPGQSSGNASGAAR